MSLNYIIQIPYYDEIKSISYELDSPVYFVGGVVRDLLLGREITDVDLVCFNGEYTFFAKKLSAKLGSTCISFKDNMRLVKKQTVIDISKPRGKNILEDLNKRDFTINNLAMNLEGEILGDKSDLLHRKIKHVYADVFKDDPLRMLRAFRFVSELGFALDSSTARLIAYNASDITNTAKERIFQELYKMFTGKYLRNTLRDFFCAGRKRANSVGKFLFSELAEAQYIKQPARFHKENILNHSISVAEEMFRIVDELNLNEEKRFVLISAAILHDCGKKTAWENNSGRNFAYHDIIGEKVGKQIMKRLGYPSKCQNYVVFLIKHHLRLTIFSVKGVRKSKLQKYVFENRKYIDDIILLSLADNMVKKFNIKLLHSIILRIRNIQKDMDLAALEKIKGTDILNMGVEKGPEVSRILKEVHFRLAFGYLKNYDEITKFVQSIKGET